MRATLQAFLEKAARGENVYISDVRKAFSEAESKISCNLSLVIGGDKRWEIRVPAVKEEAELRFVREYFYATLYNILSTFGGTRMTLSLSPDDTFAKALCDTLDDVFQVNLPKSARRGYGKCLNVTDRINASQGKPKFSFVVTQEPLSTLIQETERHSDAVSACRVAVEKADSAVICGIDIGGTDIKVVGIRDGKIAAVKEYDWFPAEMTKMEHVIEPILLMARVVRAAMSLPDTAEANALR